ncbi:MAG TPA: serine protein kinase, partial [Gammaproteobacteria bacterium]|nr:serine protein kinase [Gammaproteobacteria bacterium]
MGTTIGSFADIIGEDRKARQEHSWTGSFLDYLELVRQDPSIAKLAHARLFEAVTKAGVTELGETDDPRLNRLFGDERLKVYRYFEKDFFGIERSLAQIVRYLHSAALRGEES